MVWRLAERLELYRSDRRRAGESGETLQARSGFHVKGCALQPGRIRAIQVTVNKTSRSREKRIGGRCRAVKTSSAIRGSTLDVRDIRSREPSEFLQATAADDVKRLWYALRKRALTH